MDRIMDMNPGPRPQRKFRAWKREAFTTALKGRVRTMKTTAGPMLKTVKNIGILQWVIMTAKLTGTAFGVVMKPAWNT
jgi:hypothetical protein